MESGTCEKDTNMKAQLLLLLMLLLLPACAAVQSHICRPEMLAMRAMCQRCDTQQTGAARCYGCNAVADQECRPDAPPGPYRKHKE